MITTTADVCNLALARLGARRLVSFDADTTTEAKSCRLHFDMTRDGLLRRHQWDFATVSAALERAEETPLSEYSTAWTIPSDCVRVIRLSSGYPNNPITDFCRRGREILTGDHATVELIYVTNDTPIDEWDSLFIEAFSLKLAAKIAGDVTQNPSLAGECNQEFESLALPHAQTADAREASSGEGFGLADLLGQSRLAGTRRGRGGEHWAGEPNPADGLTYFGQPITFTP